MKTWALVVDTFREALARRIFWAFFFASTALLIFFVFIMRIDVVQGMIATVTIFGKQREGVNVDQMVRNAQGGISGFLYTVGMGLAIFASAGLISAVFEPGRVELLLSKPVPRHQILMGRYLGNLLIVAANLFYLIIGFWTIFGIKTGVWRPHLLLAALVTLFVFAVMLAFILLTGVLWESAAVSILATFALIVLSFVLAAKPMLERLLSSEVSRNFVRVLYYVFPKMPDIGTMLMQIIRGDQVTSWMPLWSTALFGVVTLGSGLWIFSKRDF
jgi:ABC-type transport system involved in multi-copper enzyme maturation permease subunit